MATTRNYLDFVCTQLEEIWGIDYKRMFGEYQIYVNDKPVLLVCDNTVFVKITRRLRICWPKRRRVFRIRARSRRKFWTWKTAR